MTLAFALVATVTFAAAEGEEAAATEKEMVRDPSTGEMVTAPEYRGTFTFANRGCGTTYYIDSWFGGFAGSTQAGVTEKLGIARWEIHRDVFNLQSGYVPLSVVTGSLAESWEQPDPNTYIFHIRKGVHWHDKAPMNGRELTAEDVVFNWHRMMGMGEFSAAGGSPHQGQITAIPFESITATDLYTVVFKTTEAQKDLLAAWAYRAENAFTFKIMEPPFNDVNVRKAMQMALDLETINDTYYKGFADTTPRTRIGDALVGFTVPFDEWPEDLKEEYAYNPQESEQLLDEAGYPRGADGMRFKTDLSVIDTSDTDYFQLAAEYWKEIGVDVEIIVLDRPAWMSATTGLTYEGMASTVAAYDFDALEAIREYHSSSIGKTGTGSSFTGLDEQRRRFRGD